MFSRQIARLDLHSWHFLVIVNLDKEQRGKHSLRCFQKWLEQLFMCSACLKGLPQLPISSYAELTHSKVVTHLISSGSGPFDRAPFFGSVFVHSCVGGKTCCRTRKSIGGCQGPLGRLVDEFDDAYLKKRRDGFVFSDSEHPAWRWGGAPSHAASRPGKYRVVRSSALRCSDRCVTDLIVLIPTLVEFGTISGLM